MADVKDPGKEFRGDSPERQPGKYGDVLNDPEMEGLTLYEKKALLVNRELDSHGMGEYPVLRDESCRISLYRTS